MSEEQLSGSVEAQPATNETLHTIRVSNDDQIQMGHGHISVWCPNVMAEILARIDAEVARADAEKARADRAEQEIADLHERVRAYKAGRLDA